MIFLKCPTCGLEVSVDIKLPDDLVLKKVEFKSCPMEKKHEQEKTKPETPNIFETEISRIPKDTALQRPFYWTGKRTKLLKDVFFTTGIDKIIEANIFPGATRMEILKEAEKHGMILNAEEKLDDKG